MQKLDLPPVWTLLSLISIMVINWILPNPNLRYLIPGWLALLIIFYGIYLIIWSALTMRRAKTTLHPNHNPKHLVTSGPFALSRNPIYLGMLLISFGFHLFLGSVYGILAVVGLFFVLRQRFVEPEEIILRNEFGEEAQDYMQKIRRWI